jgi:hypothetical protein
MADQRLDDRLAKKIDRDEGNGGAKGAELSFAEAFAPFRQFSHRISTCPGT